MKGWQFSKYMKKIKLNNSNNKTHPVWHYTKYIKDESKIGNLLETWWCPTWKQKKSENGKKKRKVRK